MSEFKEKCHMLIICPDDHNSVRDPRHGETLLRVGRLLDGQAICLWCTYWWERLTTPPVNDSDAYRLEELKTRFPGFWKQIQKIGIDKVRFELKSRRIEVEPDQTPKTLEQALARGLTVTVKGIAQR
jgi:hypothetical protein